MRLSECLRDRQRGTNRDRSLDQLLQRRSAALGSRRQDARRGLCYAGKRGEIGGVIEPRIHLSQAAKLSRNPGPPLPDTVRSARSMTNPIFVDRLALAFFIIPSQDKVRTVVSA